VHGQHNIKKSVVDLSETVPDQQIHLKWSLMSPIEYDRNCLTEPCKMVLVIAEPLAHFC